MAVIDNALLQLMLDKSSDGIIAVDTNDQILYANNLAKKAMSLANILPMVYENKIIKVSNKTLACSIEEIELNQSLIKLIYLKDISAQTELEEQLFCFNSIINSMDKGIAACDRNGRLFLYNDQLAKFDRCTENVIGKHVIEVWGMNPDESLLLNAIKNGKGSKYYYWKDKYEAYRDKNFVASTYPVIRDDQVISAYVVQEKLFHVNREEPLRNGTRFTFKDVMGESVALMKTVEEAIKAARSDVPIMIFGETGTGKEMFAQSIHNASTNHNENFVAINCAAIPDSLLESTLFGTTPGAFTGAVSSKGLFEQAEGGTVFLDEINSMSLNLQAKILRVIQEKTIRRLGATTEIPINCRIISSTNEDPYKCVLDGRLRRDLYYRLSGIGLKIPPLRERQGDVEILANYFVDKFSKQYQKGNINLSGELLNFLKQYSWPGNIRELEHLLGSCIAMMDNEKQITPHHLPSQLLERSNFPTQSGIRRNSKGEQVISLKQVEKEVILKALEYYDWNVSKAARALDIKRQNLQYKMRKFNIQKESVH